MNNNTIAARPLATLRPQSPTLSAGQIWRDGHQSRAGHHILVLVLQAKSVICPSLETGKFTVIQRTGFSDEHPKYVYHCNFNQFKKDALAEVLNRFAHGYCSLLLNPIAN